MSNECDYMPKRPEFDRIIYAKVWLGYIAFHPTIKQEHQIHDWLDSLEGLMKRTTGKGYVVFAEVGVNPYTRKNAAVHFHIMTLRWLTDDEDAKIEKAVRAKMRRMHDPSTTRQCAYEYGPVRSLDKVREYAVKPSKNGRPSLKLPQRITWKQSRKKSYRHRGVHTEVQSKTEKSNCSEFNVYVAVNQADNSLFPTTALSKQGKGIKQQTSLECGAKPVYSISKNPLQPNQRQIRKNRHSSGKKTALAIPYKTQVDDSDLAKDEVAFEIFSHAIDVAIAQIKSSGYIEDERWGDPMEC